ncbi:phospholipase A [Glaciecola petra]|uniref:Phospholipase A1 n=1 Tax=Glaciecola petra TaxID=3075602 RepID=A0ABU2ZRK4_9ALTE|nr:phospholipase A [Aestuariibacter sp. P117]MDT0594881.1 phospholipase A [Aestuariibacter sp. P117]
MHKNYLRIIPTVVACAVTFDVLANEKLDKCVVEQFKSANDETTIAQIKEICERKIAAKDIERQSIETPNTFERTGIGSRRVMQEKQTQFDPYVITPHHVNYILPAITTNNLNRDVYFFFGGAEENFENVEAKFQVSIKVPLNYTSMLIEGDGLYFGFTLQAWWQIYSQNISKPFRETNYQPEVYYIAPMDSEVFGGNTAFKVGIEHQSNGQSQILSRSWNRVYANFLYEKNNFALSYRYWHRLSEDEKEFEFDSVGDDNPDIEDFLGSFELGLVYKWQHLEFSFSGRQNFSTHRGSAEFSMTFPLWGKMRGYATAFDGYGESLIDYNYSQTRFGLGVALNNVF